MMTGKQLSNVAGCVDCAAVHLAPRVLEWLLVLGLVSAWTCRADGRVVAWGRNEFGQTRVPGGLTNVVSVSAGDCHSLALQRDGRVVAWGPNNEGQTLVPPALTNAISVSAGAFHNLALRADGTVVAWGWNGTGQTEVPFGLTNVVAVGAGTHQSLALQTDGRVVAWGRDAAVPVGLRNAVAISAGSALSLALRADGTVVAWGPDWSGGVAVPPGLVNVIAVSAGNEFGVALRSDGTVVAWGRNDIGQVNLPPDLVNQVAISAGTHDSLALRVDGTVVSWGGQNLATGTLSNVVDLSVGGGFCLALVGSPAGSAAPQLVESHILIGTVDRPFHHRIAVLNHPTGYGATGLPPGLELDPSAGLITGRPTAAGSYSVGLSATNTLGADQWTLRMEINLPTVEVVDEFVATGIGNAFNHRVNAPNAERLEASGLPPGLAMDASTGWISGTPSACGDFPVSVLASNRLGVGRGVLTIRVSSVVAWGRNPFSQAVVPPALGDAVAVAAGDFHGVALRADGTAIAWGGHPDLPQSTNVPPGLSQVVEVASGFTHSLARRADGTVIVWGGQAYYGQTNMPPGLSNVVQIAAGGWHSLARRSDGTVVAWGYSFYGQTNVPPNLSNVVAVAAGGKHSLAVRADGTVVAWGDNNYGQTNVPPGLSNVLAVAAGYEYSLALCNDGSVVEWGPGGVSYATGSVAAVAAGYYHRLALRTDGTVDARGENHLGQTDVPPGLSHVQSVSAGSFSLAVVGPPSPLTLTMAGPNTTDSSFRQTGLLTQRIRVYNTTAFAFPATRVVAHGLPAGATVYNLWGRTAEGLPYIQYNQPIAPGASVELTIEYYVPSRVLSTVTLVSEVVEPAPQVEPSGTPQEIARSLPFVDDTYLIDFRTLANRTYYIQYSSDLETWKTALPPVTGTGSTLQWVDNGPPKTESHPRTQTNRFYRVLLVP